MHAIIAHLCLAAAKANYMYFKQPTFCQLSLLLTPSPYKKASMRVPSFDLAECCILFFFISSFNGTHVHRSGNGVFIINLLADIQVLT